MAITELILSAKRKKAFDKQFAAIEEASARIRGMIEMVMQEDELTSEGVWTISPDRLKLVLVKEPERVT
jgi:hypothetical protein